MKNCDYRFTMLNPSFAVQLKAIVSDHLFHLLLNISLAAAHLKVSHWRSLLHLTSGPLPWSAASSMSPDCDRGSRWLKSSLADVCRAESVRSSWSVAAIRSRTSSAMCKSFSCIRKSAGGRRSEPAFLSERWNLRMCTWQGRCVFTCRGTESIYLISHHVEKILRDRFIFTPSLLKGRRSDLASH